MIVREHLPLRRVWPQISKLLSILFLYDVSIMLAYTQAGWTWVGHPGIPLAMMGAALSLFLAFRNNSAYDRWWEARTLWGGLVNNSRTFSRQVLTLIDDAADHHKRELVNLQIAYVHALRCHLRNQNPYPELVSILPEITVDRLRKEKNVPAALLLIMGERLQWCFERGYLDSIRLSALDRTLTELCNVQGGCERIKNTPLPRQYDFWPRMMVRVYCLMVPIGLVSNIGLLTPIASAALSVLFILLDAIGREIENPFENTVHDTPMSGLSRTIEINLRQNLRERKLPSDVRPVQGFVY